MNLLKAILLILFLAAGLQVTTQPAIQKRRPTTGVYKVTEVADTSLRLFKAGDIIEISLNKGLVHNRNGKLLNRYKIIPTTITKKRAAPCQTPPCPEFKDEVPVFYLQTMNRYIMVSDLSFKSYLNATPAGLDRSGQVIRDGQIELLYVMKKVK